MNHPSVIEGKKAASKSKRVAKSKDEDDNDDGPGPSAVIAAILPFFGIRAGGPALALA